MKPSDLGLGARWSNFKRTLSVIRLAPFDESTPEGRSKERYRRIGLTAASSFAARGISMLTALISVPLTIGYLGTERYGLWMTIASVITILGFADLGIGNGLTNAIVRAASRNDRAAAAQATSSGFFLFLSIGAALLFVLALIYPLVPWAEAFNVKSREAAREAGPAVATFIACFAVNMPLAMVQRVQVGFQEGFRNNLWQCAGNVLALLCVVIVIAFKGGLPWLVLAMAGAPVLATAGNWTMQFCRLRPWLMPSLKRVHWVTSRTLMHAGSLFLLIQLFTVAGNMTDSLIIAHVINARAVAQYSVVQRLFSLALLSQMFITPLWPAFGDALQRSDHVWARRTMKRALILGEAVTLACVVPLLFLAPWLVTVWTKGHVVPTHQLIAAFACWSVLATYGGVMSMLLNTPSLLRRQVVFFGAASIASFVLKIVLTQRFGIPGVVYGTLIGYGTIFCVPAALTARAALQEKTLVGVRKVTTQAP
jgi:O-antigen/teichoic acid export membrane protein